MLPICLFSEADQNLFVETFSELLAEYINCDYVLMSTELVTDCSIQKERSKWVRLENTGKVQSNPGDHCGEPLNLNFYDVVEMKIIEFRTQFKSEIKGINKNFDKKYVKKPRMNGKKKNGKAPSSAPTLAPSVSPAPSGESSPRPTKEKKKKTSNSKSSTSGSGKSGSSKSSKSRRI